jgi:hypothetical protein
VQPGCTIRCLLRCIKFLTYDKKLSPPRRSTRIWSILIGIAFVSKLNSCKKQELYDANDLGIPVGIKGTDVISTIDSLQQIGFFIQNRPNPDVPVKGVTATNTNIQLLNTGNEMEYTDETYMVLGLQLNNPYSIPNMTAAYNAFLGTQLTSVSVTHRYVRFTPGNEAQLALLDDSLELDLYTQPLDHEMLTDGDLYVAPGKTIEDLPYLYTVVPAGFSFPAHISYTVLSDLHLPVGEAALYIEELAESMALGASYSSATLPSDGPTETLITRQDVTMGNGEHPTWRHNYFDCYYRIDDPNPLCPGGGGGGINPPPPPPPPPATVCGLPPLTCVQSGYPRGRIRVWDTQLNTCVPVHGATIKVKRWFRISTALTNESGAFSIATMYNNNAKVNVVFRNSEVSVKPLRNRIGIRLSLFPVKASLGSFSGCGLNTVDKIFYRTSSGQQGEVGFATGDGSSRFKQDFLFWLAANAINTRKYQIAQGKFDKVKPMEGKHNGGHRFQLYLATGGTPNARQAYLETPMLAYINKGFTWNDVYDVAKVALYAAKAYASVQANNVIATASYSSTAVQSLLTLVFQGALPDAIYFYNTPNLNLSSSEVHQKFSEAYTIAGLLKDRSNKSDWKSYLKKNGKIINGVITGYNFYTASKELPLISILLKYTDNWFKATKSLVSIGSASLSLFQSISTILDASDKELFDMYNGYAEAYSHFTTNRKYGTLSDAILDQNFNEIKSTATTSSNLLYIETWRSKGVADKMSTISMSGIFYDLYDGQNDLVNPPSSSRLESVQNISWENIAKTGLGRAGFSSSPDKFSEWRSNLTQTNSAQSTAINNLFNWYIFP